MIPHRLKITSYGAVAALVLAAFATGARAQAAKVDVDEHRTTPVGHRFIHGTLGDADFQMALPDTWNGKLLIGARGFSGDEDASGEFKTTGLRKGYAYALSDQGWARATIINETEDKYYESKRRIHQLTAHTKAVVHDYYGAFASRTFMVGGSNGGHNTKMMVEEYPRLRFADSPVTDHLPSGVDGLEHALLAHHDVRMRINDIIAARTATELEPGHTALEPAHDRGADPGAAERLQHAGLGGDDFNVGRVPSSTDGATARSLATPRLGREDGQVLRPEWRWSRHRRRDQAVGSHLSPPPVANDLRRFDHRQPQAAHHHRPRLA
jgi:hypothetical protein